MNKPEAIQLIQGLIAEADAVAHDGGLFDAWRHKCRSVLGRIFGDGSSQIETLMGVDYAYRGISLMGDNRPHIQAFCHGLQTAKNVLKAFIWEIEQFGTLRAQELVHSDLFADMLEAAEYLLGETYKDPAAVMAGGVLEQHLRELCRKNAIDTTFATSSGDVKPKMIDLMNMDLAKASAYGKIEQKQVTAWAGIRNAAAHGEYAKYDENQVRQIITGIRDFIAKYPA
jgi:hypothetical protein